MGLTGAVAGLPDGSAIAYAALLVRAAEVCAEPREGRGELQALLRRGCKQLESLLAGGAPQLPARGLL